MSSNFRYKHFVAVSGNLGGKVSVVDDVLLSHEQKIYPITSLDENCVEVDFQTDRNYYVDLRQTYLAVKQKAVNGCGYETCNTKENKEEHKKTKSGSGSDGGGRTRSYSSSRYSCKYHFSLSFSHVEVYINNQQIYNSNGLYAKTSYLSNNLKGTIFECKQVLHCEGYDHEKFHDEPMEALLLEIFFTR